MKLQEIPIKEIDVVENHRLNIEKTDLHELMESIKQHGLKQAIGVAQQGKRYILLFGHRRLLACKKLGHQTINATVEKDITDEKMLILNLTENMQREEPTFAEYGRIINKLTSNLSEKEIAVRLGLSIEKIRQILKVYNALPEKFRSKVMFMGKGGGRKANKGKIPAEVATEIVKIKHQHQLSDKTIEKVFDHVDQNKIDSKDLKNLSIMIDSGVSADEAMKRMMYFGVFTFDFVGANEEIVELLRKYKMPSKQHLFRKIMYGEIPAIKKPDFVQTMELDGTFKNLPVKERDRKVYYKRIDMMRNQLNVKDRLEQLTDSQSLAIRAMSHKLTLDLNEEQINQIEGIFNETNKKAN